MNPRANKTRQSVQTPPDQDINYIFSARSLNDQLIEDAEQQKLELEKQNKRFSNVRHEYLFQYLEMAQEIQKKIDNNQQFLSVHYQRLKSTVRTSVKILLLCLDMLNIMVYIAESYDIDLTKPTDTSYLRLKIVIILDYFFELTYECWIQKKNFKGLIKILNVTDLICFVYLFIEVTKVKRYQYFAAFRWLRSLKIVRIMNTLKGFFQKHFSRQEATADWEQEVSKLTENENIKFQIITILFSMIELIFISAGIMMMFEELKPNYSFYYNGQYARLNYLWSLYFMVVNLSTIGYGDLVPANFYSRLWLTATLMIYIMILSNHITKLTECMRQVSRYEYYFTHKNHIVVVGRFNQYHIYDFVKNFFNQTENDPVKKAYQILIINDAEPSESLELLLQEQKLRLNYLKISLLNENIYQRANLLHARAVYAFQDVEPSHQNADDDRKLKLFLIDLHFRAPTLEIICYYGNHHTNSLKPPFKVKESLRVKKIKNYILGSLVMNKGLQVIIYHLSKCGQEKFQVQNELLEGYGRSMGQCIEEIPAAQFFWGKQGKQVVQQIYFASLLYKGGYECDASTSGAVLIGVQRNKRRIASINIHKPMKRKLYSINSNVVIQKSDRLLVLCDRSQIPFLQSMSEATAQTYESIMAEYFQFDEDQGKIIINKMIASQINLYKSEEGRSPFITCRKYQSLDLTNRMTLKDSIIIQNKFFTHQTMGSRQKRFAQSKKSETIILSEGIIDLTDGSQDYYDLKISNHIIIFGDKPNIFNLVLGIRRYTQRMIVFFTETQNLPNKYNKQGVLLVKGQYFNYRHLNSLNIRRSFKIIILSENSKLDADQRDMDCLILLRAIYSIQPQADIIFEFQEINSLNHCMLRPTHEWIDQYSIYPQIVSGHVFLSSSLYTLISQCVFNDPIFDFIKFILGYRQKKGKDPFNICDQEKYLVHSLTLTNEAAAFFQVYGVFATQLLLIPIGLVTCQKTSIQDALQEEERRKKLLRMHSRQKKSHSIYKRLNQTNIFEAKGPNNAEIKIKQTQQSQKLHERINMHQWKGSTVLTNPPALHVLFPGDTVIVFGKFFQNQESKKMIEYAKKSQKRSHPTIQYLDDSLGENSLQLDSKRASGGVNIEERKLKKQMVNASLKSVIKLLNKLEL